MKIGRLLKISRPRFWIYELGAFVVGIAAAYSFPIWPTGSILLAVLLFALFFLFPANLFIYGINDIYDFESDRQNPKKGGYEALVVPQEHRKLWLWIIATNIPFAFIAFLLNLSSLAWGWLLAFWFFAGFYSAPPIRAKTKPVIDSFFSGAHYVATGGFAYVLASGTWPAFTLIIAGMCWTTAMHIFSAIPDIKADRQAGMKTFAVILGKQKTLFLCLALYLIAALLVAPYVGIYAILLWIPYAFLIGKALIKLNSDKAIFKIYRHFPLLNTLMGMIIFFIAWLYQV